MEIDYLQAADIWSFFKIESKEDFLENHVLKGKFHPLVPEKIIKDYETVERLSFFSYFYYPLIDEAFSKSTRIFEASVTLRLENDGKKKDEFESLNSKLNRLKEHCSQDLFEQWKHSKELRNMFAHREAGALMGITLLGTFKHILNMINSVFLHPDTIKEGETEHLNLVSKAKNLSKGIFVLEYNEKRILVQGAKPFTTGILNNKGKSLWVFIPITGDKVIESVSDLPKPIIVRLENLTVNNDSLTARIVDSKYVIKLSLTNNQKNIDTFRKHVSRMDNLLEISMQYNALLKHSLNKEVANFIYEAW